MLFTASLMVIPARGFLSLTTLALLIASGGLFVAFVVRCRRVNNPVLELSLLRHPRFVGVLLLPVATCCCYVVLLIIVPLHFMGGEGMSESQSALYLMALTAPMLVFPSVAALLTRWFSPGQVSTAGLMMASVGLLLLGDAFHSNHLPQLVLALILCGAGAALPGTDGWPGDIRCAGRQSRYGGRPVQHRTRCRRGDRPGDSLRGINGKQYPDPAESRSRVCA